MRLHSGLSGSGPLWDGGRIEGGTLESEPRNSIHAFHSPGEPGPEDPLKGVMVQVGYLDLQNIPHIGRWTTCFEIEFFVVGYFGSAGTGVMFLVCTCILYGPNLVFHGILTERRTTAPTSVLIWDGLTRNIDCSSSGNVTEIKGKLEVLTGPPQALFSGMKLLKAQE